jgi:hypothetical protein
MKNKLAAIWVMSVLLFMGAGCGTRTIVDSNGIKVRENSKGEYTMTDQDGGQIVAATDHLPDNFPTDVPVYAGAKITSASLIPTGATVSLEIHAPAKTVLDWYQSELKKQGWKISSNYAMQDNTFMSGAKTDGSNIIVTLGPSDNKDPNVTMAGIVRSSPAK